MIEMSGYGSSQLWFICTSGWSEVHTSLALYHWVEDKEEKPCCYSTLASAILWVGTQTRHGWISRLALQTWQKLFQHQQCTCAGCK